MRTEWWKPVIFDFHTDETAGERFRYRMLEVVVAGWACWFAWSWGPLHTADRSGCSSPGNRPVRRPLLHVG